MGGWGVRGIPATRAEGQIPPPLRLVPPLAACGEGKWLFQAVPGRAALIGAELLLLLPPRPTASSSPGWLSRHLPLLQLRIFSRRAPWGGSRRGRMEPSTCISVPCYPENATPQPNTSSESASDLLVTSFLGCILATTCAVGVVGNIYTLVVTTGSTRCTGSMYVYIVTVALADLLYLPTIPFVVCTYFARDWYFGDLGCRILFSLDLLTMHASIFILTIMSTEHYLAVIRPLDTLRRLRDHRQAVTCLVWLVVTCLARLVAFLLTLPAMILIDLRTSHRAGVTKRMCHPTWRMGTYRVYLTILFNTCILTPGITICCLYTKLARTYCRSQRALVLSTEETSRCPRQKVLCPGLGSCPSGCGSSSASVGTGRGTRVAPPSSPSTSS